MQDSIPCRRALKPAQNDRLSMDMKKLPLLATITGRMGWLNSRQEVLARNIANADTPGYVPHDLKPTAFRDLVRGGEATLAPRVTNMAHLSGTKEAKRFADQKQRETYETTPDGNAVVLEEQLLKVAETAGDYQTATNLYRRYIAMFRTAIGRN
ncbi:MAG: flagellar basal body protein [Pseudomonadota bacterium]